MLLSFYFTLFSFSFLSLCTANSNSSQIENAEDLASQRVLILQENYQEYIKKTLQTRQYGCTPDNIVYRREWGQLSKKDRREYIDAVYCLQKKAPWSSKADIPGARSRFDDFAGVHIQETPFVHFSGLFFPFHRYFVWLYETALREECGYSDYQPYWDWTISWEDPRESTVFDGSPYSMGSNGQAVPHGPTNISAFGLNLTLAPATGGGCVYMGPFTPDTYQVHLGPVAFQPYDGDGGLEYNPRCLVRDLSAVWANNTRPTKVLSLLEACDDIGCFDTELEAIDGVHAGGHFAMGGLGLDAYASAGDPAFWLHHAQIDRVWTIWQNQAPAQRTWQTAGTGTAFNEPPSPNVTLDTWINFGVLAAKEQVRKVSSTIDGPFCYMYL
ncbi:hypothetical protein BD289DRAFT_482993 [Coniella lustricola]|uniref:Tyrosinase copper-binding domain-containing protein n=1 Tax=Coniella lustricola TaxID=2025994 RepID=A0A2T3A6X1_9PEZI|nr:hypothetical protein BD289DRAFT_482993 [Coniella lustricola]